MAASAKSGASLVDQPALSALEKSFADVHGVGLAVLDDAGRTLAEVRLGGAALERLAAGSKLGVAGLRATQEALRSVSLEGGTAEVRCTTSVRYLVRPILQGDRQVGRVVLGPYALRKLLGLPRLTQKQARKLSAHLATLVSALAARPEPLVPGEVASRAAQALGSLSHELRTPLTSIIGFSDMLAEGLLGPLSPEQREGALTILERSESLLLTLNSLLDLAATALGPVSLLREPTDLAELLADAVEALAAVARRARVSVRVEVEPSLPAIAADRSRLKESLVQLLGNAIKFNHPGGVVTVRARRRASPAPEQLELEVQDTGIGIDPAQLNRLFEPFYQVDSSPTRSFPGVGKGWLW